MESKQNSKLARNKLIAILLVVFVAVATTYLIQFRQDIVSIYNLPTIYNNKINSEKASNIVMNLPEVREFFRLSPNPHMTIENIDEVSESWNIHVYEDFPDHTVTLNWYEVNKQTGEVIDRVTTLTRDIQKNGALY